MPKRRYPRSSGVESNRAYLARRRAAPSLHVHARIPSVEVVVYVATCPGTEKLSRLIGLPIACIGVARDPGRRLEAMSRACHGALRPCLHEASFGREEGWDAWRLLHVEPEMAGSLSLGTGVELVRGCVRVGLDRAEVVADVGAALAGLLRHRRVQDVVTRGEIMRSRIQRGGPLGVPPRYTAATVPGAAPRRVDDIYVFDPWCDLAMLGAMAESAVSDVRLKSWPGRVPIGGADLG